MTSQANYLRERIASAEIMRDIARQRRDVDETVARCCEIDELRAALSKALERREEVIVAVCDILNHEAKLVGTQAKPAIETVDGYTLITPIEAHGWIRSRWALAAELMSSEPAPIGPPSAAEMAEALEFFVSEHREKLPKTKRKRRAA